MPDRAVMIAKALLCERKALAAKMQHNRYPLSTVYLQYIEVKEANKPQAKKATKKAAKTPAKKAKHEKPAKKAAKPKKASKKSRCLVWFNLI